MIEGNPLERPFEGQEGSAKVDWRKTLMIHSDTSALRPGTRKQGLVVIMAFIISGCGLLYDRSPPGTRFVIDQTYFTCGKCHALEGGIYGKGPTKRYRTAKSRWCVHKWRRISKAEFRELAAKYYGEDWSKHDGYWWNDWKTYEQLLQEQGGPTPERTTP